MFIKMCAFLCASVKVFCLHAMWHLVVEVREEKRKTGWPALLLIRNPQRMPADDGQVCHTSRRAIRWLLLAQNGAALLGILALSASPLHSNPERHMGKGNLKSRTAQAGILRLPSSLSWELKRQKELAVCTSQPSLPRLGAGALCGETTAGKCEWVCVPLSVRDTTILHLGAVRTDG